MFIQRLVAIPLDVEFINRSNFLRVGAVYLFLKNLIISRTSLINSKASIAKAIVSCRFIGIHVPFPNISREPLPPDVIISYINPIDNRKVNIFMLLRLR